MKNKQLMEKLIKELDKNEELLTGVPHLTEVVKDWIELGKGKMGGNSSSDWNKKVERLEKLGIQTEKGALAFYGGAKRVKGRCEKLKKKAPLFGNNEESTTYILDQIVEKMRKFSWSCGKAIFYSKQEKRKGRISYQEEVRKPNSLDRGTWNFITKAEPNLANDETAIRDFFAPFNFSPEDGKARDAALSSLEGTIKNSGKEKEWKNYLEKRVEAERVIEQKDLKGRLGREILENVEKKIQPLYKELKTYVYGIPVLGGKIFPNPPNGRSGPPDGPTYPPNDSGMSNH